jgi:NAD(P)H-hydrate epimerase
MIMNSPTKLVSVAEMIAIEKQADQNGYTYAMMMDNAGLNLASVVDQEYKELLPGAVLGLVGTGNNGGDTLVALDYLGRWGWKTAAYIVRPRPLGDPLMKRAVEVGCEIVVGDQDGDYSQLKSLISNCAIILDGILGTGIQLPLRGRIGDLLATIKGLLSHQEVNPIIVAVDCPSGVDCDSGDAAPECIPADITVTMAGYKQGLFKFPAHNVTGEVRAVGIGLPDDLTTLQSIRRFVVDENYVIDHLPERRADAHKGTFGALMVIAGCVNYPGAALLAGQAAYRSGVGLVTLAVPRSLQLALAGHFPEATWLPLPDEDGSIGITAAEIIFGNSQRATATLIGPGLGLASGTKDFLSRLLKLNNPLHDHLMVIDADGLKLLASLEGWNGLIPSGSVLTPHPGEMSILTGISTSEIQASRVEIAEHYAKDWGHTVVLKGAFTVIASPEGDTCIVPIASAALARAGSGDVLAGLVAGLLAQGMNGFPAAVCGAWIHGQAGLRAAGVLGSTASVLAGDILQALVDVMAEISD